MALPVITTAQNTVKIENLSAEAFSDLQAQISKQVGKPISGFNGTVAENGYEVAWTYFSAINQAILTFSKRPIFVTMGLVTHAITEFVTSAELP